METLEKTNTRALRLEYMGKRHGGWWLELINRDTGKVKILTATNKKSFKGITIDHVERWCKNEEWKPMYKANSI